MVTGAERTVPVADVLRLRPHRQARVGEPVFDLQAQRERIARLRVEEVFEHDARRLLLDRAPVRPAHEPVDRAAVATSFTGSWSSSPSQS